MLKSLPGVCLVVMRARTAVIDVVGAQLDGIKSEQEVDAILGISLDSTENAIRNFNPIADWDVHNRGL